MSERKTTTTTKTADRIPDLYIGGGAFHHLRYTGQLSCAWFLAVRVVRVSKSGLLSRVDGQAIVVLNLDPGNGVSTLEGIERREPS